MTARIDALNNRTTMEYDAVGRLTAVVDPLGRRTEMTYDEQNRLLSMKDPSNALTTYTYDENGNQTSMTNADGKTWRRIYDVKNRLLSATDPLGRTTRYAYDSEDQLIRVITPSGRTVRYAYDARGYRTSMTDGEGGTVNFTYDHQGNLSTLSDQRGNTTTFTYDELYRVNNVRNPLGQLMKMNYDAVGNVIERTDKLGRQTTYTYDGLNRPTHIVYTDATVDYIYDAANRRTQITDSQGGTISWGYDDANRILSETTPVGTVAYSYNNASQIATMTAANRPPVTYGYDSAGRLSTITQSGETFTYGYDLLSRMTGLQRPNGVDTTYTYNEVNRLTRLKHQSGANPPIEDLQYTYNADDEIEVINSLMSGTTLPTPKTVSAADGANRIAQFGDNNYVYDAEGQITSKVNTNGLTQYTWDARGRLTQARLANGQTVSYGYDALGRRQSRTAGTQTTTFLYEGADVVLDQNSDGTSVGYLNGGGIDNKLRQTSAVGSLYFLQDHLRSTIGLTSANGSIVETQRYEAFGDNAGSAFTRYGYTGRERDNTTGLLYYRARWYDPQKGRFITEDPIGFNSGNNFYSYVKGNPLSLIDPFGFDACYVHFPDYPINYFDYNGIDFVSKDLGGHAGVLGYDDKTGDTRYYEYGRYDKEGKGKVKRRSVPDLEIGQDGQPTQESLEKLKKYLSDKYGKKTPTKLKCEDIDEKKVYDYAEEYKNNPKRPDYSWNPIKPNHCRSFAKDAITEGR
jgi:RHS repeat-associated protein